MRYLFAFIAVLHIHTGAVAWQQRHGAVESHPRPLLAVTIHREQSKVANATVESHLQRSLDLVRQTDSSDAGSHQSMVTERTTTLAYTPDRFVHDLHLPNKGWPIFILCLLTCLGGIACGAGAAWLHLRRQAAEDENKATGEDPVIDTAHAGHAFSGSSTIAEYDNLLRTLAKEAVHRVGPTLSRGQAIRGAVEKRAAALAQQAKLCFFNELNNAAGDLCEAVDAPEAMLLFDLESAVESHFPTWSVLLAGLMAPLVLTLTLQGHILQISLVLLPIAIMCSLSFILDFHTSCSVIPTLGLWLIVQTLAAYTLIIARLVLAVQTHRGQTALKARIEEEHTKLDLVLQQQQKQGAVQGLRGLRDLFISKAGLLQQALVLEYDLRKSSLRHVVGAGTLLWIFVMLWGLVLMIGWTFMPGVVYFSHRTSPAYCSSFATVFTLKTSCTIMILCIVSNVGTVCHWIADLLVESDSFSSFVMNYAAAADQIFLGLPVIQILTKAFVLRGSTDLTFSRLSIAVSEKARLAEELSRAQSHLEQVQQQFQLQQATVDDLKGRAEIPAGSRQDVDERIAQLEQSLTHSFDVSTWREKGENAIRHARMQAKEFEQSTADVDSMAQRLTHAAQSILTNLAPAGDEEAQGDSSVRTIGESVHAEVQSLDLEALKRRGEEALHNAGLQAKKVVEQTAAGSEHIGSMAQQLSSAAQSLVTRGSSSQDQERAESQERVDSVDGAVPQEGKSESPQELRL